jgi:hypothetical protein
MKKRERGSEVGQIKKGLFESSFGGGCQIDLAPGFGRVDNCLDLDGKVEYFFTFVLSLVKIDDFSFIVSGKHRMGLFLLSFCPLNLDSLDLHEKSQSLFQFYLLVSQLVDLLIALVLIFVQRFQRDQLGRLDSNHPP